MKIQHFFDERTSTLTYVVHDERAKVGVVIDSVTDYDPKSGRAWNGSNHEVARYVDREELRIPYVLDTHAHADHLSGMPFFKERYGAKTVIGWKLPQIQALWAKLLHLGPEFRSDGSQFDVLLEDRQVLDVGPFAIEALWTPGHTPACMTYRVGGALFVGDVLFMPDYGVARCDFPDGSADALYGSVQHLYTLPGETRVFTCHDYRPGGREIRFASTIGEQQASNVQLTAHTKRDDFIRFRLRRDAELEMPVLLIPSVQVNIRAGYLPEPEANGIAYLKTPLNVLGHDPEDHHD